MGTAKFIRHADGKECEVDGCFCETCKNYFWVQHTEIEPPKFCPYCGVTFTFVNDTDDSDESPGGNVYDA